ncbi:MAG: alpha/beta hydrolase [Pseudomonadota bacterium]|nr:alpha/beta hydrolase [Pseudomonadota bacterium]
MSQPMPDSRLTPWALEVEPGFRLRGWRTKSRGLPVLHFIHGNGFCGLAYWPLLSEFVDEFDLILTDVQGHGDSDAGGAFLGWNRTAEHCIQVIEAFRAKYAAGVPWVGMGHSFGGAMTLCLAGLQPNAFSAWVGLDAVLHPPTLNPVVRVARLLGLMDRSPMVRQALARTSQWPNRESAWNHLHGRGGYRGWDDQAFRCFVEYGLGEASDGTVRLKCPPWLEAQIYGSQPLNYWRLLKRVKAPGLLLHGDRTIPFVAPASRKAAQSSKWVAAQQTAGGHCFMLERPEAIALQVRDWLRRQLEGAVRTEAA